MAVDARPVSALVGRSGPVVAAAAASGAGGLLSPGAVGPEVRRIQARLGELGYWLGTADGRFGDRTEQAVYAFQKAAGLVADGIVGPKTRAALARGALPPFRPAAGSLAEIDLRRGLLMILREGRLAQVFNVSSGGGYRYVQDGVWSVASTPRGHFVFTRQIDALVHAPLGELWRPKYFVDGYAVHGSGSVPPTNVSHGCVRVSYAAMDWMWANHLLPMGSRLWIY
ncbi:MAG: L,D-transpeptidase family protein [Actinomycetota bacterium]|nr:L,D-transpeptidase family protein [Actinomycetota bacterium]